MEPADVMVLGSGVVGSWAADLVARSPEDREVRVIHAPTEHTATYSNHGWYQSGLLYHPGPLDDVDAAGREQATAAELMRAHGARLGGEASIRPEGPFGIFRVPSFERGRMLEQAADALFLGSVRQLTNSEAEEWLGRRVFDSHLLSYRVPDGPFAESELLEFLRRRAEENGAVFTASDTGARLIRDGSAPSGYVIETSAGVWAPKVTLVAVGVATPRLLAGLGKRLPLRIFRSPLMRIEDDGSLKVPLVADLGGTGMAILRHTVTRFPLRTSLVVGNRERTAVAPLTDLTGATPTHAEIRSLVTQLPKSLQELVDLDDPQRCKPHVCFKIEREVPLADGRVGTSVMPWLFGFRQFPYLIVGGPGKATLGRFTAEEMVRMAGIQLPVDTGSSSRHRGGRAGMGPSRLMWYEEPDEDLVR